MSTQAPPRARPYWHTLVANLLLAGVLFLFAWLLGGGLVDATIYAVFFFVGASAWSAVALWRKNVRERRLAEEQELEEEQE